VNSVDKTDFENDNLTNSDLVARILYDENLVG
jgi:hypothetical protein